MVSTFTPNIQLEEPARGDQVGVWDTPVNGNMTLLDLVAGAITTISLNNSPVVLSAAQFKSKTIVFNSTLTGSVAITFPTSFTKSYEIQNLCTGSSAFVITLTTTAAGSQVIGCKPGEIFDVVNSAGSLVYKNLGHIGSYWDYGGSSVPNWVSACSVAPYLNCDGSTFSAATYPALAVILGSTTLPNSKGKTRFTLDQGAGLISSAVFSGAGVGATGGAQTTTLSSLHLPKLVDPQHTHALIPALGVFNVNVTGGGGGQGSPPGTSVTQSAATGITYGSSSQIAVTTTPPAYIGGLTLIRAG